MIQRNNGAQKMVDTPANADAMPIILPRYFFANQLPQRTGVAIVKQAAIPMPPMKPAT